MKKIVFITAFLSLSTILAKPTELDTIIVSSTTGFEEAIVHEPKNVYIIQKEEISNGKSKDIKSVLSKVPSITFRGADGLRSKIDLRGMGSDANIYTQVLVNDIPLNMANSTHGATLFEGISLDDIERIEVIPGGGAVMYGSGTMGGVINIITKSKTPHASFGTRYASGYNDARLNFGRNLGEKLFLKAGFMRFKNSKFRNYEKEDGTYLSFGMNYEIAQNQNLDFDFLYFNGKSLLAQGVSFDDLKKSKRSAKKPNDGEEREIEKYNLSLNYMVKFDNFEIKVSPFYQKIKNDRADKSYLAGDEKYGTKFKAKYDYELGNLIFGYDYIVNKGEFYYSSLIPRFKFSQKTNSNIKKITNSAFAINKFEFGDEFSLNLGYRFEHASYKSDHHTNLNSGPIFGNINKFEGKNFSQTQKNHAFEIVPSYNYSSSGNVYFKFEKGFTSPSANKAINKIKNGPVYPSKINSQIYNTYEVGLKDFIFGNFISLTAFLTNSKDEIYTQMDGSGPRDGGWINYNIGKTQRKGVEIFAMQEFERLRLKESLSFIDTKVKESGNAKDIKVGEVVPEVPKYKIYFGAEYDLSENFTIFGDTYFYGDAKTSKYEKISSYNVTDIGANFKYKNLSLTMGINNLFDKEYYADISGVSSDSKGKDTRKFTVSDGRNYYVEFRYDF